MSDAGADRTRGREAHARGAWAEAHEALSAADRSQPLRAPDVELLAVAAYMLGREAEYLTLLERAHRAHVDADDPLAAFRCAFWIGTTHAQKGPGTRRTSSPSSG